MNSSNKNRLITILIAVLTILVCTLIILLIVLLSTKKDGTGKTTKKGRRRPGVKPPPPPYTPPKPIIYEFNSYPTVIPALTKLADLPDKPIKNVNVIFDYIKSKRNDKKVIESKIDMEQWSFLLPGHQISDDFLLEYYLGVLEKHTPSPDKALYYRCEHLTMPLTFYTETRVVPDKEVLRAFLNQEYGDDTYTILNKRNKRPFNNVDEWFDFMKQFDEIFFPMATDLETHGAHWFIGIYTKKDNTVRFYDSSIAASDDSHFHEKFFRFVFGADCKCIGVSTGVSYGGNNCGLHAIYVMRQHILKRAMDRVDLTLFRLAMAHELVKGKVLYDQLS